MERIAKYIAFVFMAFGVLLLVAPSAHASDYTGTAPTVTAPPITTPVVGNLAKTGIDAGQTLGLLFVGVLAIALGTVVLGEAYRRRGQGYGAYGKYRKPSGGGRWLS